jgi:hypothetical protein
VRQDDWCASQLIEMDVFNLINDYLNLTKENFMIFKSSQVKSSQIAAAALVISVFASYNVNSATIFTPKADTPGKNMSANYPGGVVRYVDDPDSPIPTSSDVYKNFCSAIDYYQQNTHISFEDVNYLNLDPGENAKKHLLVVGGKDQEINLGTPPQSSLASGDLMLGGFVSLVYGLHNASTASAVHEFGHALGLWHEHQRLDRDGYVDVKPDLLLKEDYLLGWRLGTGLSMWGGFDHASIMRYDQNAMLKLNNDSLLWHAKNPPKDYSVSPPRNITREFFILAKDTTLDNSFDNLAISNDNSSGIDAAALQVQSFADYKWGAHFDFEWVGSGNRFRIKHRWSGKYLSGKDTSGQVALIDLPTSSNTLAQWDLIPANGATGNALPESSIPNSDDDGEFLIKNAAAGVNGGGPLGSYTHLKKSNNSSILVLGSSGNAQTWIIKARNLHDEEKPALSNMDRVGLHIKYKKSFIVKHVDSTPNNPSDNPVVYYAGSAGYKAGATTKPAYLGFNTDCDVIDKSSPYLCMIEKGYINSNIHALNNGSLLFAHNGLLLDNGEFSNVNDYKASMLWSIIPREDHFVIKNKLTGKYWSKPQADGKITMVTWSSGNVGKWLIDDNLEGKTSYSQGKQRSATCATALGKGLNY